MSSDASAMLVVGVHLREKELYRIKTERSCKCEEHPRSKFCPDCGKPVIHEVMEPRLESKKFKGELPHSDQELAPEIYLKQQSCSGDYFLGYFVETTLRETWKFHEVLPFEDVKTTVRAILNPLGLWDHKKFGVYVVQCWH